MLNSDNFNKDIERIDKFERFLIRAYNIADVSNMKQLSEVLGVSYDLFRKKDINVFPYEKLEVLSDSKNVNIKWLMSGEGSKYKNQKERETHVHSFFILTKEILKSITKLQDKIIEATDPNSEDGVNISDNEREDIKISVDSVALKLKDTASLAGIKIEFKFD